MGLKALLMRALIATFILTAVALAGCASEETPADTTVTDLTAWTAGKWAHPAEGLAVTEDLPIAGDTIEGWPAYWYQPTGVVLPDQITRLVPGPRITEVESGAGIAVFGSLAFVGSYSNSKIYSIDISNMEAPEVISVLEGASSAGDLDTIAFPPSVERPEGQILLIASTRGSTINVIDVTNPANMTWISGFEPAGGNHNHQVLPGTALVYNAQSGGEGSPTAIWDLSDPEYPVEVTNFENGYGCHAIDFFIDAELGKYLGFCAGLEVTQIFNVTDPRNPTVISTAPWPVAGQDAGTSGSASIATFSHLAMGNNDGTVMIVGDESGGGAAPACDFSVHDPVTGTTVTGPLGNLYFYDITDPTNPVLHGSVSPNVYDQRGSCTAHFGGVIEDRDQLVMAFYTAGVALIDFSDIDNPYVQDLGGRDETDDPCTLCGTWDAQVYRGHVITGDVDRGMDLLTFA
jgi:hypothetical protein